MGSRIESLDMAKGLGIVAVLVMHICVMGTAGSLVFMALFSYAMPFYFLASGYTYKPGRGVTSNVARRAKQILIPMSEGNHHYRPVRENHYPLTP